MLSANQVQTNCLTEVLFDDAIKRAQILDKYYEVNGKVIGPLHGIPITLKDQFNVKGVDTTLGYVGMALKPSLDDAAVVKILQDLGAIVIAKTNLPQSIMVSVLVNDRLLISDCS
jgi:amidase